MGHHKGRLLMGKKKSWDNKIHCSYGDASNAPQSLSDNHKLLLFFCVCACGTHVYVCVYEFMCP